MISSAAGSSPERTTGVTSPLPAMTDLLPKGFAFCEEIERRFGREAVDSMWDESRSFAHHHRTHRLRRLGCTGPARL